MKSRTRCVVGRAVALVEVVIALAVVGVLLMVFSLGASDSRRVASLGESLNNLKQFAWAGSAYAADCNERFWTFSWTQDEHPKGQGPFPDILSPTTAQAIDIIRRHADSAMPAINIWIPHIFYSHLVLVDHLNLPLPTPWVVSPEDKYRLAWQRGADSPLPLPGGDGNQRWSYSSTYMVGSAFFSRDMREGNQMTFTSGLNNHYTYIQGTLPLGGRLFTQVANPSRKVMLWDTNQRHFGTRQAYFGHTEARVPMLTVDGSADVRFTQASHEGFDPNRPTSSLGLSYNYEPRFWEPPTLTGAPTQLVRGYYQWTRGGLAGRDFDGPEVCTGQPGCTP